MTTTTVFADASDGRVSSFNATYSIARTTAVNVTTNATQDVIGGQLPAPFRCYESFFQFDTSGIPDGDSVDSATFSIYGQEDGSVTDFIVEVRAKDWGATLTTADWVSGADLGSLTLLASHDTSAGWSLAAYNDLTSEVAFLAAINKTGQTHVMCSSSRHRIGNQPSGNEYVQGFMSEQAGTTQDPKLVVVHSAPLDSITLLPATASNPRNSDHTVTATVLDADSQPRSGVEVRFTVTGDGSPTPNTGVVVTDANGEAAFTFTNSTAGANTITACTNLDGLAPADCTGADLTATATKTWTTGRPSGPPDKRDKRVNPPPGHDPINPPDIILHEGVIGDFLVAVAGEDWEDLTDEEKSDLEREGDLIVGWTDDPCLADATVTVQVDE